MADHVTTTKRHQMEFDRLRVRIEQGDAYWPAQVTLLIAVGLGIFLSDGVRLGPAWLIPTIEASLLLVLIVFGPRRADHSTGRGRTFGIGVICLIALTNIISLALLVHYLVAGDVKNGEQLILSGVIIWSKNVLIFAVLYWELDRGGPVNRFLEPKALPDFQFPQMENPSLTIPNWQPGYFDYLYTSLTNATAFSPTDVMPLTITAKLMMGIESVTGFMTIGLVVARAVNILG
jgi:uncharacterized membrane protein